MILELLYTFVSCVNLLFCCCFAKFWPLFVSFRSLICWTGCLALTTGTLALTVVPPFVMCVKIYCQELRQQDCHVKVQKARTLTPLLMSYFLQFHA